MQHDVVQQPVCPYVLGKGLESLVVHLREQEADGVEGVAFHGRDCSGCGGGGQSPPSRFVAKLGLCLARRGTLIMMTRAGDGYRHDQSIRHREAPQINRVGGAVMIALRSFNGRV